MKQHIVRRSGLNIAPRTTRAAQLLFSWSGRFYSSLPAVRSPFLDCLTGGGRNAAAQFSVYLSI